MPKPHKASKPAPAKKDRPPRPAAREFVAASANKSNASRVYTKIGQRPK